MRHSISNSTDQCQNSSSNNLLTPCRGQPRSNRIVVAYPRSAFSTTKRTNHTPISIDQQAQVSQGNTSCINKENWNTEVHGGGDLDLVKSAREQASRRPKPCASLKNVPRISHVGRSLLALVGRKQNMVIHQLFPQKPFSSRLRFSRTGVQHSPNSSTIELPSFHPRRIWCVLTRHCKALLRPTGLPATVPPSSRAPLPLEGHLIGAPKGRTR